MTWTPERTRAECEARGHPAYGPVAPGMPSAPDRCLCGDVFWPPGPKPEDLMCVAVGTTAPTGRYRWRDVVLPILPRWFRGWRAGLSRIARRLFVSSDG